MSARDAAQRSPGNSRPISLQSPEGAALTDVEELGSPLQGFGTVRKPIPGVPLRSTPG